MEREVRVRFAPSPTGALHIGGVRTALYNYLFAKKTNGKFIIRIEDTDQTRYVEGAEEYIMKSLEWLGITPDESPLIGGDCKPYRQSERKPMYKQYAMQLIEEGKAYYAFDTAEELDAMRQRLEKAKVKNPSYNAVTRTQMKNSLTLPADEVKARLESGEPYVIRIKIPKKEEIRLNDLIRGWVMVHSSTLDDKVLMKSDGMPTYHLANVVDDYLMKITHVIRGEEWLPSAPLHVLLYQYLGWENVMPRFAHLPLLLNPDGKGKLSKRKAKEYGFPVFPLEWKEIDENSKEEIWLPGYKEQGYLPEALLNFLALLGWSPGTNQEIFGIDEMIENFSLERINKAGVKFDIDKAKWFNQQYLRTKSNAELAQYLQAGLKENNVLSAPLTSEKAEKIAELMKERATFPQDFWKEALYLFQTPTEYNEALQQKWTPEVAQVLQEYLKELQNTTIDWNAEEIKHLLHQITDQLQIKIGKVMAAIRIVITGVTAGPDLMMIQEIIGKEELLQRIKNGLAQFHTTTA
ncbi:MAG: glutamate--tRNA ligase [Cytophagales bacterium]|nr:MAG: glutamate--tRNA ligase [Cytophagales bacterium]